MPFQFDFAVAEERLREEVTLSAQNVSIGDVLALLLEKNGFRFEARQDGVHILEAGDAPPTPQGTVQGGGSRRVCDAHHPRA